MNDASQMQLFCSQKWETILKIKTHLMTKNTARSGTGTIRFFGSVIQ